MAHTIDQGARDMAQAAQNAITSHEAVCAQRWNAANDKLDLIVKILGWGGATAFFVILAALGFK